MKRLADCELGVVAVELAVILPVALLFLLGIMEGGRILSAWVVLSNEAREAARYGAITDYYVNGSGQYVSYCGNLSAWQTNVKSFATNNVGQVLATSNLAFNPAPSLDCSTGIPTSATVVLDYSMTTVTPLIQAVLPSATVKTTSTMRAE